jgi:hypothetical protein
MVTIINFAKEAIMTRKYPLNQENGRKRSGRATASKKAQSVKKYRVGWCRPPKQFQFKPGVSGNPRGRKRMWPSIELSSNTLLTTALIVVVLKKTGAPRAKSKAARRRS